MRRTHLPITALPAWAKFNNIDFIDVSIQELDKNKGHGLLTTRSINSKDTYDIPTLVIIPQDLVLSAETVQEHARVDVHFRELLELVGGVTLRGNTMLFLLMQLTMTSSHRQNVGVSNPWTEYVKLLPDYVPLPTLWSEEERFMLVGTSLESALAAKVAALDREFENLREKTAEMSWCRKCWWDDQALSISDWVLIDAWYRSRSLELPKSGESMVPCLDMVNHSSQANAYYEQSSNGSVSLLLRPNMELDEASEITISYGASKSEAEILFSYGFIDEKMAILKSMVLPLEPMPDDPLAKAKLSAFSGPPTVRLTTEEDCTWESPFLYLMCLNEEDGLDFRVLQETDGTRSSLRVFWQGKDVTESTSTSEDLIKGNPLQDVFRLRAVALLQDRIQQQLERLFGSESTIELLAATSPTDHQSAASRLRSTEAAILERAFEVVDQQKNKLLESESVLQYLGSMQQSNEEQLEEPSITEADDFS